MVECVEHTPNDEATQPVTPSEQVRHWLEMVTEHSSRRRRAEWRYSSFEHLILEEGVEFTVARDAEEHAEWIAEYGVEVGEAKLCFMNAGRYLLEPGHGELYYAEGYAHGIIPIHHAWLVTRDGRVIDPTWHGQGADSLRLGGAYVGVAFAEEALKRKLSETEVWGMYDWRNPTLLVDGVDEIAAVLETEAETV